MTTLPIRDQVCILTGASSGLGAATARLFAAEGAKLVLTARRTERLEHLAAEITTAGGHAIFHAGDAGHEQTATAVQRVALDTYGRIDILINNAGQGNYKQLVDTTPAEYDTMMSANMRSSFLFSRAVAPGMIAQGSGTIIFVSSVAGIAGAAKETVYCASKFAQVGFSQALAEELLPSGIKVTSFCPGGIKTDFAVGAGRTEQSVANSTMMDPAEVAESLLYICQSPRNVRVTQLTVRHMGRR